MKKTLVKSKIVLENNGETLTTYMWKKIFLCFGYWYPFGTCCGDQVTKTESVIEELISQKISFEKWRKKLSYEKI